MNDFEILNSSRLIQVRVTKTSASRPIANSDSGVLEVEVKFSVKNSKPGKTRRKIGTVKILLTGKPEAAEDEENGSNEETFTLEIEARGVFSFPNEIDVANTKISENVASIMCNPIYMFAKAAADNTLRNIGLANIKIETDLRSIGEKQNEQS